jgi:hypothetical protein
VIAAFGFLLRINRDQWFFGDDWAFLTEQRTTRPFLHEFLDPHNEHWTTVPYLIYRALDALVGLNPYWPYVVPVLLAHLLVTHMVWRIGLRVGGQPWIVLGASVAFAFLGAGYENLLWAFQIAFVGATAFGMAALVAVDHGGRWGRRDWLAVGLVVLSLACSGIGILMLLVVALAILLRRGVRTALLFTAVPTCVYFAWAAAYYAGSSYAAPTLGAYLQSVYPFTLRGLTSAADLSLGLDRVDAGGAGAVLVLILAGALIRRVDSCRGPTAVAYACAAGAIGLYALTAYGRWQLGVDQASASRYAYVAVALLFPAVVLTLTWLVGDSRAAAVAVCVGFLAVALNGASVLREKAGVEAVRETAIRATMLAAAKIATTGRIVPNAVPEPVYSPDVTVGDLVRWWRAGELRSGQTDAAAELTAALNLQTGITAKPLVPRHGQPAVCKPLPADQPRGLAVERPTSLLVQSAVPARVLVSLRSRAGEARSADRTLVLPGGRSYLNLLAGGTRASITAPGGTDIRLCRGGPTRAR